MDRFTSLAQRVPVWAYVFAMTLFTLAAYAVSSEQDLQYCRQRAALDHRAGACAVPLWARILR